MTPTTLSSEWNDYVLELRQDAHQLLAWGYSDARVRLTTAKDEYEMTGLLAEAMEERIDSPKTPERFMYYAVHNEAPTSPAGELGKKRPKLDIRIERCGVRPKAHFTFEAKRLRDDPKCGSSETMRKYLGTEGVLRFITGRYARESIEAAMLGCIQAHDANFWFEQLGSAFDSDTENGGPLYAVTEDLRRITVIPDLADESVSGHSRTRSTPIRIFHLFIDCR